MTIKAPQAQQGCAHRLELVREYWQRHRDEPRAVRLLIAALDEYLKLFPAVREHDPAVQPIASTPGLERIQAQLTPPHALAA